MIIALYLEHPSESHHFSLQDDKGLLMILTLKGKHLSLRIDLKPEKAHKHIFSFLSESRHGQIVSTKVILKREFL
jgi:hypothetical protein